MEQGRENGLIILRDGTFNKPTQYTEDTKKGCICLKHSTNESGGYEVHQPTTQAAFQPPEL